MSLKLAAFSSDPSAPHHTPSSLSHLRLSITTSSL
jgi:hypothetical protein